MSCFTLQILTPEREVFNGLCEAAVCPTSDGDIEILKGHQNLVAALKEDEIKIKINGEWTALVVSEGVFEVRPDKVIVFAMYCDSAENYNIEKQKRLKRKIDEKELRNQSVYKYKINNISLSKIILESHKSHKKNINFK